MLTLWTIYERPKDFPQGYVVRAWHIGIVERVPVAGGAGTATTLEGARKLVPPGLFNLGRYLDDEPQIVETWV